MRNDSYKLCWGVLKQFAYDLHLKIVGRVLLHSYWYAIATLCWKVFEKKRKNCKNL